MLVDHPVVDAPRFLVQGVARLQQVVMAGSYAIAGVSVACHLANRIDGHAHDLGLIEVGTRRRQTARPRHRPAPIAAWRQPRAAPPPTPESGQQDCGGGRSQRRTTTRPRGRRRHAQHLDHAHEVARKNARPRRVAVGEQHVAIGESAVDVSLLCFDDREAELRLDGDLTTAHR